MSPLLLATVLTASAFTSFEGNAYYIGEPHQHTGISGDGQASDYGNGCGDTVCGSLAEVFETARDNGLDWLALTDHVNAANAAEPEAWEELFQRMLGHDDQAEGLVVVPGAEVIMLNEDLRLGHRNLYLFASDQVLSDFTWEHSKPMADGAALDDCESIATWLDEIEAEGFGPALLVPHHSNVTSPMWVDFSCWDPDHEVAVEVYSGWGNHLGGPLGWWDEPVVGVVEEGHATTAMDPDGFARRFGFIGGTDAHLTLPGDLCLDVTDDHTSTGGLTILVMPEGDILDRNAIHDAIVDHRSYVSTGPAVPVAVDWSSGGELVGTLGQDLSVGHDEPLELAIRVPKEWAQWVIDVVAVTPDEAISLEASAEGAWTGSIAAEDMPAWIYPAVQLDPPADCEDGGEDSFEWLFVSPSWIEIEPPDDTGPDDTGPDDSDPPDDSEPPDDTGPDDSEAADDTGEPVTPPRCGCGGCGTAGSGSATWLVWLLGLVGWMAATRRR